MFCVKKFFQGLSSALFLSVALFLFSMSLPFSLLLLRFSVRMTMSTLVVSTFWDRNALSHTRNTLAIFVTK